MHFALLALMLASPPAPGAAPSGFPEPCPQKGAEVVVEVDLDRQGSVTDARIARPSGVAQFDRLALGSALTWKGRPATEDGLPVASTSRVPVRFEAGRQTQCSSPLLVQAWTARATPAHAPRLQAAVAPGVATEGPILARWNRFGRQGPVTVLEQSVELDAAGAVLLATAPQSRQWRAGMYSLELRQGRKVLLFQVFEVAKR